MKITKRKLSYHHSYTTYPECPCLLIGNRRIAKKYGWEVGDEVSLVELPEGILITKKGVVKTNSDRDDTRCAICKGELYDSTVSICNTCQLNQDEAENE